MIIQCADNRTAMATLSELLTNMPADRQPVAAAVAALAAVAADLSATIRRADATAQLGAVRGSANADGDDQKKLDVLADEMIASALANCAGVAAYLSEERDSAMGLDDGGDVIVASDPLDGSSNIDTNVSIGTIFSILPAVGGHLQPGRNQLASGIFVYGPQTTLLVTFGDGVFAFQLAEDREFYDMGWQVQIPPETSEFAINASNSRHWRAPVSRYVADCLAGVDGPRQRNFNMRWVGSLVADGWRIFRRGGISCIRQMPARDMKPADCGWSMRPTQWPCWLAKPGGGPAMASRKFLRSPQPACISGSPLFLDRLTKLTNL